MGIEQDQRPDGGDGPGGGPGKSDLGTKEPRGRYFYLNFKSVQRCSYRTQTKPQESPRATIRKPVAGCLLCCQGEGPNQEAKVKGQKDLLYIGFVVAWGLR